MKGYIRLTAVGFFIVEKRAKKSPPIKAGWALLGIVQRLQI